MPHTNAWDETKPAGSDFASTLDDQGRQLKLDLRERLSIDHVWNDGLSTDGFHKKVTFQPAVNTTLVGMNTTASLTGANAQPFFDLTQTWNTSGTPTFFKVTVTDTASAANSLLMDLRVGVASKFSVTKEGIVTLQTLQVSGGTTFSDTVQLPTLTRIAGSTASFPALKRNGTTVEVRLADDSAFGHLSCSSITLNSNDVILNSGNGIVVSGTRRFSATTGGAEVNGTLLVSGVASLDGGFTVDSTAFTVANTTGIATQSQSVNGVNQAFTFANLNSGASASTRLVFSNSTGTNAIFLEHYGGSHSTLADFFDINHRTANGGLRFLTTAVLRFTIDNNGHFFPDTTSYTLGTAAKPWGKSFLNSIVGNIITPAALSANQNDYNPTGLSGCTIIRQDISGADRTVTGLVAQETGRRIYIHNMGAPGIGFNLIIANNSGSSSAANRIRTNTGANITVSAGGSIGLYYNGTDWNVFAVTL